MTEYEQYPETPLNKIQSLSKGKKLIIFNGPPSSGKDEACKYIEKHSPRTVKHIMFKQKLTELTQMIYGVNSEWWNERYTESGKNIPRPELNGLSQRNALIFVSETVIKPNLGNDYFGKATVKDIISFLKNIDTAVVSDCGFIEEIDVIDKEPAIAKEDVLIVRCHRDGYDFSGDSRSYVDAESYGFDVVDLWNDGDLNRYHNKLCYCFYELLSEPCDYDTVGNPIYHANTCSFDHFVEWFGVNGFSVKLDEGDITPMYGLIPISLDIKSILEENERLETFYSRLKEWHEFDDVKLKREKFMEYLEQKTKTS